MLPTQPPVALTPPRALDPSAVRFFSGSSHRELAAGIAGYLGVPLDETYISRFSNNCLYVQLGATVRGRSVFIVQSLAPPVDEHLMELLMMLDIARSASARQIHAVIPYYSYARSDKKDAPRISITARLVADLLNTAGATHVMTMTLHSPQVHGFFSMPTDPLTARHLFVKHFAQYNLDPTATVVVAPDIGGAKPASRFAALLNLPVAAADKVRISDHKVEIRGMIGEQVQGRRQALVYDDEIATGGSVVEVARWLLGAGIEQILVACTHGLFTGDATERLAEIPEITEIVTTDTVPLPAERRPRNLKVLSVAPVFGEAIRRNCQRQSIGTLFSDSSDNSDN